MFLRAGELNVRVQVSGPPGAPALLMLHSLGSDGRVWDGPATALDAGFRVIRPDMRGHGLTASTPGPYRIEQLAQDALQVLDALGIRQAHVAGLSIGGLIAQSVAAQAPGRVLSLVLCDTALCLPPPEMWRDRAAAVRAHGVASLADGVMARWVLPDFLPTAAGQGLRTGLLRTDAEGYAGAAEAIAAADLTESTRALRLPALVLVGAHDPATPPSSAEALRDAIPGAELVVIPDAAHIPTAEQPEAVAAAMRRFLQPDTADRYQAGLAVRRAVLGEAHVARSIDAATAFDRDFQRFITETAWGGVWTRPHFSRRTRSLLTLAVLAALGHHEEFKLHVRATRNTGATAADIAEMLQHVAVYAGVPAANSAVRLAKETLAEMDRG